MYTEMKAVILDEVMKMLDSIDIEATDEHLAVAIEGLLDRWKEDCPNPIDREQQRYYTAAQMLINDLKMQMLLDRLEHRLNQNEERD